MNEYECFVDSFTAWLSHSWYFQVHHTITFIYTHLPILPPPPPMILSSFYFFFLLKGILTIHYDVCENHMRQEAKENQERRNLRWKIILSDETSLSSSFSQFSSSEAWGISDEKGYYSKMMISTEWIYNWYRPSWCNTIHKSEEEEEDYKMIIHEERSKITGTTETENLGWTGINIIFSMISWCSSETSHKRRVAIIVLVDNHSPADHPMSRNSIIRTILLLIMNQTTPTHLKYCD